MIPLKRAGRNLSTPLGRYLTQVYFPGRPSHCRRRRLHLCFPSVSAVSAAGLPEGLWSGPRHSRRCSPREGQRGSAPAIASLGRKGPWGTGAAVKWGVQAELNCSPKNCQGPSSVRTRRFEIEEPGLPVFIFYKLNT